jgi:hypothetical protein
MNDESAGWNTANICGFDTVKKVINDNTWHPLDLDMICKEGDELYTPESYKQFFCKIFGLQIDPNGVQPHLSLWRLNRKYVVYFRYQDQVYHINLWKKTLYRGEPTNAKSFPIIWDEDQMELDLMCIFLLQIVDR